MVSHRETGEFNPAVQNRERKRQASMDAFEQAESIRKWKAPLGWFSSPQGHDPSPDPPVENPDPSRALKDNPFEGPKNSRDFLGDGLSETRVPPWASFWGGWLLDGV